MGEIMMKNRLKETSNQLKPDDQVQDYCIYQRQITQARKDQRRDNPALSA